MEALALHQAHASAGARFGELRGREVVAAFAEPATEDAAARAGAALFDASYRDLLRFTGPDRVRFLQGMLTQDVAALAEGASAPAALCTAKGGLVGEGQLLRRGEELWLAVEPGSGARVRAALERFLVADEVEISDGRPEWAELELWGPKASALVGAGTVSIPARLGALVGARLFVPRAGLRETSDALREAGAIPCGFDVREAWRVEAGVPRFGADMDEDTLPLEVGLEAAISYTKGCYLGQEVIARATYRGHVNWKLGGVALGAEPLPVGTELTREGKPAGRLTSVVRSVHRGEFIALARLRHEVLAPGTPLNAGERAVRVHALPFAG
jgi:folate-binding protein YgfZ